MPEYLVAFLCGAFVGLVFKWLNLPIPAPQAFAGIAGIIGIYVGYRLI